MISGLFQMFQDKIVFGHWEKRLARWLLNNPAVIEARFYQRLYDWRMAGEMKRLSQKPLFIRIETTNRCRANCSFCPHKNMQRREGEMALSLYRRIIDQVRCLGISRVNLHGFGEPFMDSRILDRIVIAKTAGIENVATNTNGSLLNDRLIKGCLEEGLDEIYISIDAASESTYRKIRPGLAFDRAERNIRKLIGAKRQRSRARLKIFLSFVACRENQHEVRTFVKKWSPLVDGISISYLHNWGGRVRFNRRKVAAVRRDPCRHLWAGLDVNIDGRVPLCCYDYESKTPLGDLSTEDLDKIWHGDVLARYRDIHRRREFNRLPLCRGCNVNFHNKNPWWLSK